MKQVAIEVTNHSDEELRIFRPVDPAQPVTDEGVQGDEAVIPARGSKIFKGEGRIFLDASYLDQPGAGNTVEETSSGGD